MASSSFDGGWQWPENLPGKWTEEHNRNANNDEPRPKPSQTPSGSAERPDLSSSQQSRSTHQQQRHYGPRTCRICLETVLPSYEPPSDNVPGIFQGAPHVTYSSPDGGRLIRPCLCKGSQKYVHEGCLAAWRLQDPNNKRNYWQCPTCKYSYRLERMTWGRYISSTASQIGLTVAIFVVCTFMLGYVADPIINLYLDPYSTIAAVPTQGRESLFDDEPNGWIEHFLKGFASLGLLGFAKFLLTLSPWHWFNMRGSGVIGGGGRAGATGRDRLQQISWIAVLVGVATVTWAVWKGVRAWSRRTLAKASERVMDVPIPDDNDDDD